MSPLLTLGVVQCMQRAFARGEHEVECSLDLERTRERISVDAEGWQRHGTRYPYPERCKERTVYHWVDGRFEAVARYSGSLIKLVPTEWGPPTFEIDGIKMLPSAHVSPYADALTKVALVAPRGKSVLDTCGGLGYFAAGCLAEGVQQVSSYEKNPNVIWLRSLNPWSPGADARLRLVQADITGIVPQLAARSVDCVLHDPPRFGIAGELYSQDFYDQLARVLKLRGRLLHYTGTPNKLTSGRDVPAEVTVRLRRAGFTVEAHGDSLLAVNRARD